MRDPEHDFSRELDWNLLKTFAEIARSKSLSEAAFNLQRKQPSISQALQRLESCIGVRLCRRTSRSFELTEEGRIVADICQIMAAGIDDMPGRLADAASRNSTHIRLLLISNLLSPQIDAAIAACLRHDPHAEIDVEVAPWRVIEDMIVGGEGDIAIAPTRSFHRDLEYHLLFHEVNRPFCGRAHPLYGRVFERPESLVDQRFILTESDEPAELREFRLRHGLGRHVAGRSERLEEAKRLTMLGVGICFLPDGFAASERAGANLWSLLPDLDEPAIPIYAMLSREASPETRRFLGYLLP